MERGSDSVNTVVGEEYAQAQTCTSAILKGGAMPGGCAANAWLLTPGKGEHLSLSRTDASISGRLFLSNSCASATLPKAVRRTPCLSCDVLRQSLGQRLKPFSVTEEGVTPISGAIPGGGV